MAPNAPALPAGTTTETHEQAEAFVATLAERMEHGAAFFLDWVATDETARTIGVEVGGSHPMGPADAFMPEVDPDTVTAQTLEAGAALGAQDGSMDFIANATGSIFAQGWTPELQKLVGGKTDAAGLLKAVQAVYAKELAS